MPVPFSTFDLNKQLLNAVAEMGYEQTTEIQEKAIPKIMGGAHVMGIAQTGTGKTAAYLLPILMKLKYAQGTEPRCLIIVPTRELGIQIAEQAALLSKYTDLRSFAIYGGLGPKTQIEKLKEGCDILIATPGRFQDLYLEGHIAVKKIQVMVMDEADRLMDMGFIKQIHNILEVVRHKKQCLLFSATMSPLVRRIADDFLEFPIIVEVEPEQRTASTVSQLLYLTPNLKTKLNLLNNLLAQEDLKKVIIFCRTRTIAEIVYAFVKKKFGQINVRVIHANKGQNTRMNAISSFKATDIPILIATDVAARGLDVEAVSHVINFEVPVVYEDYIHRIGRTGRAFLSGESITFCNPSEEYHIEKIEKLIKQQIPRAELPPHLEEHETPYEERQEIAREIDRQKRKENPEFKGAFHEKKFTAKKEDLRSKGDKRNQMRKRKTK